MFKCGTSGPGISNFRSQKFRPKIFSVLAEMNPIRSLEFDKAQQSPPGISSRQCMFLFVFFLKAHLLPLSTTSRRALNTRTRAKTSNIPLVVYGTALVTKSIARWVLSVCRHILLLAPDLHTINVPWRWMNNSSHNDSLKYIEGDGDGVAIWCGKWEYVIVIAPLVHLIYSNPPVEESVYHGYEEMSVTDFSLAQTHL